MPGSYYTDPIEFLIHTLIGLYIMAVLIRFLMQWARADFHNPIGQMLIRITNPPLMPLRRVIPPWRRFDLAALALMLLLQIGSLLLIGALRGGLPSFGSLAILALAELIALTLNLFFFTILIGVILSWVMQDRYHPVYRLLHQINEPLLGPLRRLLPPMGGLDLSPLLAIIAIHLAKLIMLPPLMQMV